MGSPLDGQDVRLAGPDALLDERFNALGQAAPVQSPRDFDGPVLVKMVKQAPGHARPVVNRHVLVPADREFRSDWIITSQRNRAKRVARTALLLVGNIEAQLPLAEQGLRRLLETRSLVS
jgi:hypothetical protein